MARAAPDLRASTVLGGLRDADVVHTTEVVGRGGGGIVYKGVMSRPGQPPEEVAVKRLLPGSSEGDERRFRKEAGKAFAASEKCPGACRMYGCVKHEGTLCLVMKKYPRSLHAFLDERRSPDGSNYLRPLTHDEVTGFTEQILAALGQLHAEGIVVQDLKPGNILMDESDQLVISDFGLAVAIGATTTVTTTQSTNAPGGGTPAFMAPEQYDPDTFGKVSQKTDMWALGCVVIEMLTGFAPWRGKQPMEIMMCVAGKRQAPPVPAEAYGSVLAELLRSCLAHAQDARPTAGQALASMHQQPFGLTRPASPQRAAEPAGGGMSRPASPQPTEVAVALQQLRVELTNTKLKALKRRARRVGVDADVLEDVDDEHDVKGTVIALILEKEQARLQAEAAQRTAEAAAEAERRAAEQEEARKRAEAEAAAKAAEEERLRKLAAQAEVAAQRERERQAAERAATEAAERQRRELEEKRRKADRGKTAEFERRQQQQSGQGGQGPSESMHTSLLGGASEASPLKGHASRCKSKCTSECSRVKVASTFVLVVLLLAAAILWFRCNCGEHGDCAADGDGHKCNCHDGYIGLNCQVPPVSRHSSALFAAL